MKKNSIYKKIISFFIVSLIGVNSSITFANDDKTITIPEVKKEVRTIKPEEYIKTGGRTYLPLRSISEDILGTAVYWFPPNEDGVEKIQIVKDDKVLILNIDSCYYVKGAITIDGAVESDYLKNMLIEGDQNVKPQKFDGKTYLPIRPIAEFFGATVGWNQETEEVPITFIPETYDEDSIEDILAIESSNRFSLTGILEKVNDAWYLKKDKQSFKIEGLTDEILVLQLGYYSNYAYVNDEEKNVIIENIKEELSQKNTYIYATFTKSDDGSVYINFKRSTAVLRFFSEEIKEIDEVSSLVSAFDPDIFGNASYSNDEWFIRYNKLNVVDKEKVLDSISMNNNIKGALDYYNVKIEVANGDYTKIFSDLYNEIKGLKTNNSELIDASLSVLAKSFKVDDEDWLKVYNSLSREDKVIVCEKIKANGTEVLPDVLKYEENKLVSTFKIDETSKAVDSEWKTEFDNYTGNKEELVKILMEEYKNDAYKLSVIKGLLSTSEDSKEDVNPNNVDEQAIEQFIKEFNAADDTQKNTMRETETYAKITADDGGYIEDENHKLVKKQ